MAAIFTLRKGSSNASSPSLTEAELYLHLGSGSIQFGSGSTQYNLLPLNAPAYGDINLSGSISASGDVRIGGNIYLGNASTDNIQALGQFNTNLIPSGNIDIGTTSAPWTNIYSTNVYGNIKAYNGVVSGSSQIIALLPTGLVSGSSQVNFTQINGISNNIISASTDSNNIDFIISVGSITANLYGGVVSGSSQIVNLLPQGTVSGSSQVVGILSSLNNVSSSLNVFTASQHISNSYFATTGSNNFYGNQSISGNVYLTGSLIPSGSSSFDLGSQTHPFQHLYVSSGSIYMDGTRVMGAETRPVKIGDSHEGGIIFYIANDNSYCLIVDAEDTGRAQSQYLQIATGATGTAIGTGLSNTNLIMARSASVANDYNFLLPGNASHQLGGQYYGLDAEDPAYVCYNLTKNGFSDWYLPSVDEMKQVGIALPNFIYSGFSTANYYWTSTYGGHGAYTYYTIDGSGRTSRPLSSAFDQQPFRAIRKSTNLIIKSGLTLLTNTTYSGSITTLNGLVNGIDISASVYLTNERLANLESGSMRLEESTASLNLFSASLNAFSASENTKSETLRLYTASVDAKFTSVQASTASINTFTQSIHQYTSSTNQRLSALETQSGSDVSRLNNIESYTSSLKTAIGVSGTDVTINGNLSVLGTTTQINSTQVNIGENILELNYGGSATTAGIITKDATGVSTTSGSLLWDATNDYWKGGKLGNESKLLLAGGDSIVSSSAQVVGILQSLNQFSSSINTATASLNLTTASLNEFSASENTKSETLRLYTASVDAKFSTLQTYTASVDTTNTAQNNRLTRIEESTASLNTFSASENTKAETLRLYTASIDAKFGTLATYTGSNDTTNTTQNTRLSRLEESTSSLNAFTSSQATTNTANTARFTRIEESTASLNAFSASQLTKDSTLQTYTASIDSTIARLRESTASLNLYTQSNDTTNNTQNTRLSRIEESTSSLNTFSASVNGHVTDINIWSASVKGHIVDINEWTGSQKQKDTTLENVTASLNLQTASFNTWTGSVFQPFSTSVDSRLDQVEYLVTLQSSGGVSASFGAINLWTSSIENKFNTLETYTSSLDSTIARLKESTASINLTTASLNGHVADINVKTGSFETKFNTLQTYTSSVDTKFSTLQSYTASVDSTLARLKESTASLNLYTQSNDTTNTNQNNRLTRLEESTSSINSYTSSLKTAITVNGSDVTVNGNLTIAGTTTQINSTQVNIGENILELNYGGSANTAGIYAKDATGGSTTSGSLLWDATNDYWMAGKKGTEAKILTDGLGVISGSGQLGNYETTGRGIVSGSSQITPLLPTGVVSGSSQVNFTQLSGISANIISASTDSSNVDFIISGGSITANLFGGVVSGSAQVVGMLASLNSYTQSNDTTNNTQNNRLSRLEESTASLNAFTSSQSTTNTANIARFQRIEESTASLNTFSASENTKSETLRLYTASIDTKFNTLQSYTASIDSTIARLRESTASLNLYTQSNDTTNTAQNNRLSRIEESTSSLNTLTASLSTTYEGRASAVKVLVSGSSQVNFTQLSGISANIISGSTNSTNVNFTISGGSITANLIGGVVSGSSQVNFTQLSGISNGIVSGAAQVTPLLPTGTVSGSSQVYSGVSGDITIAANGVATIANNSVLLGTDTIGDYVAYLVQGTGVTITNNSGEGSTPTIAIGQAVATSSNVQFNSLGVGMAASATAGRIDATNDIVAFSSSDKRFKDNIKPIENALEKIQSVGGYEFDWKEENKIEHGYEGHDIGVIAQEIEAIAPELVQTRENGYKAVKYDKIVPLLIQAIKELSAKVKELENK